MDSYFESIAYRYGAWLFNEPKLAQTWCLSLMWGSKFWIKSKNISFFQIIKLFCDGSRINIYFHRQNYWCIEDTDTLTYFLNRCIFTHFRPTIISVHSFNWCNSRISKALCVCNRPLETVKANLFCAQRRHKPTMNASHCDSCASYCSCC